MTIDTDIATCNATSLIKNVLSQLAADVIGAAGGDLSGFYPNPIVSKINTVALGDTTATAGNLLIASGTAWVTNPVTGDITIGSTGITAIGANKVTDAMIRQSAGLSIIGRSANTTGNVADITAASDFQVMRRSGTTIAFGAVNLASSNAVTGVLPNSNTTAVSINTASAIVTRDASGNFAAGTITATLSGSAPAGSLSGTTLASNVVTSSLTTVGIIGTGTWNGSVIAEIYGGTNQSTYALGDTLYSSSANTLSKLAGNTTTTRKFLRQTGNGSVSAAPAWDTITAADVPGSALTKTDDTNVTLTLGGSPSTALLNAASLTLGWTGTLAPVRGGIGLDSSAWAQGDIPYISATGVWNHLAKNTTATRYLSNTGTTNNPAWAQIDLTNGVTGVLPNGNTTAASANTASAIVTRDASGNFTAGTITAALTGNASTATALQNARLIGGASFDGTGDIVPQTIASVNEATDTTCFPLFITASGTQSLQPKNNTTFRFNSSTNQFAINTILVDNGGGALSGTTPLLDFGTNLGSGTYLRMYKGASIGIASGDTTYYGYNTDWDTTAGSYKYNTANPATVIELNGTSIDLKYAASGSAGTAITFTSGLSVARSNGNVTVGAGDLSVSAGNLIVATATKGLQLKSAAVSASTANASMVTGVVLSSGTATINNSLLDSTWRGFPVRTTASGTLGTVTVTTTSGSFTITSSSGADTSTYSIVFFKAN